VIGRENEDMPLISASHREARKTTLSLE